MSFTSEPGTHRDPAVLEAKKARQHIAPVTELVEKSSASPASASPT